MFLEDDIKTGYVNSHSERRQKKKQFEGSGRIKWDFFFFFIIIIITIIPVNQNHFPSKMSCTTYVGKKNQFPIYVFER